MREIEQPHQIIQVVKMGFSWNIKVKKWITRITNNERKRISKSFNSYEEAVAQRKAWEKENR